MISLHHSRLPYNATRGHHHNRYHSRLAAQEKSLMLPYLHILIRVEDDGSLHALGASPRGATDGISSGN